MIKRIYNVLKHWMGFSWYFQNRFQAIPTHHPPVKQNAKRRVVKSCDCILRHRCSIPLCKYMWSTCELTGLHNGTGITTFEVHSRRKSTVSIKRLMWIFEDLVHKSYHIYPSRIRSLRMRQCTGHVRRTTTCPMCSWYSFVLNILQQNLSNDSRQGTLASSNGHSTPAMYK